MRHPYASTPALIQPELGRVVYYYPSSQDDGIEGVGDMPLAAVIVQVWDERCVNLAVFDRAGALHSRTSVICYPEDQPMPRDCPRWAWRESQLAALVRHLEDPAALLARHTHIGDGRADGEVLLQQLERLDQALHQADVEIEHSDERAAHTTLAFALDIVQTMQRAQREKSHETH